MASDGVCKIILLGNGSVGKSSIIQRLVEDGFQKVYKQTVGVDFFSRRLEFGNGKMLTLQLWDVGGQSMSSQMLANYVHASDGVFLCYDITDPVSFGDLADWLAVVRKVTAKGGEGGKPVSVYLVGNKVDLAPVRRVTEAEHSAFVGDNALSGGFFVSASNGDKLVASFYGAAAEIARVPVSAHELATLDRVVAATAVRGDGEEARTAVADAIEEEDRRAREAAGKGCSCVLM